MARILRRHLSDDEYRFAYDLVAEVVAVRGELTYASERLPTPNNILFTQQHADLIRDFLVNQFQSQELDAWIKSKRCYYDITQLKYLMTACKGHYISDLLTLPLDDEQGFICTCAKIAYIGAYFHQKNRKARSEAVHFIHEWLLSIPPGRFSFLAASSR
ncbi:hypothetical protein AVEN_70259-1 [Araneus ventricosus]|uniref:Uncharacterized protein n=1 Tax=Araneus ventricosus TaxID=182803 RepID=A0A4Y2GBQ0_ARAVE|nr:hypothetical protein AVEN_70259-1 [Araneus ventricosus]